MVKLDADTVPTVPDAPPAAGPDRALNALAPEPPVPAEALGAAGGPVVDEPDVGRPMEIPATAHTRAAAATIHRPRLVASHCRPAGNLGVTWDDVGIT